jgi:uncharacterized membrane protein HdeD (DUF308 family)
MSTVPQLESPLRQELQHIRDQWLLLLILGIVLVITGTAAIICSFIAALATAVFFGTLIFAGGVIQIVNAVTCRNWRGFIVYLLGGILYGVVGMIMMTHPVGTVLTLTLMLAAVFMIGGIIRIVVSAIERFHGWGWVMVNGFISLFLGVYIWRHFPESAFWVIGLFVGIDLIFAGWSWIWLAIGVRGAFANKS